MRSVQIIADSTCDLHLVTRVGAEQPINLAQERGVRILPLGVLIDGVSYLDGVSLKVEQLFQIMNKTKKMPQTSAVNPQTFLDTFQQYLDLDQDIVFIGISSHLSGTVNSARIAQAELDPTRIFVVDSESLSTGEACTILKACDYRDQGLSAQEIASKLEEDKKKVYTQFGISSLELLNKGGRASGLTFFISRFLHIKPILRMNNGKLEAGQKVFGTIEKVCDTQFKNFLTSYNEGKVDPEYVFITHCQGGTTVDYVKKLFAENQVKINQLYVTEAGCVISSHCGNGTLGILYSLK
jgi:DegV family protein with EDD domain